MNPPNRPLSSLLLLEFKNLTLSFDHTRKQKKEHNSNTNWKHNYSQEKLEKSIPSREKKTTTNPPVCFCARRTPGLTALCCLLLML